jgi:hypothetical protein
VTFAVTVEAADQFAQVTNPGWINSNQYSWTGAWGDYDHDGFVDLFVVNNTASWTAWTNFLYRNNGDGTFTRMLADQVGPVAGDKLGAGAAYWGDVNNDGNLDLLVPTFMASSSSGPARAKLYLNQGTGRFVSANAGDLSKPYYVYGAMGGFADYDNDGCLDVFIAAAWVDSGHRTNLLFHGHGDGTFSLVTNSVVVQDQITASLSNDAVWGDFDNDGRMDLLVANYQSTRDFFYHNDGDGHFTRLTNSILEQPGYQTLHDAWSDYDNDGRLDLVATADGITRLFHNDGTGDFTLAAEWPEAVWGNPIWGDYDNDGWLDLLLIEGQSAARQNLLYHNNGDGTFTKVEDAITRTPALWLGGGWADYDNDGFLDLFLTQTDGQNALFHNLGNANHWIRFDLQGVAANRSAIGAKVRVKATIGGQSLSQMREVSGGNFCQNDFRPDRKSVV